MGNDTGKLAIILRIVFIEAISNKLGMFLIDGKDNGFTKTITAFGFNTIFHQVLEH